jgi:hypothetical protein
MEITKYLADSSASFETGKELYLKYGTNETRKSMLVKFGNQPYNVKNIRAWLKELVPVATVGVERGISIVHKAKEPIKEDKAINKEDKKVRRYAPGELPDELEKLRVQNGALYKQMSINTALFEKVRQAERAELRATNILYDNQIRENWRVIDHWKASKEVLVASNMLYKKLDEVVVTEPKTEAQLLIKRNNLRSNITKGKANVELHKSNPIKLEKYTKKLAAWEDELKQVQKMLDEFIQ